MLASELTIRLQILIQDHGNHHIYYVDESERDVIPIRMVNRIKSINENDSDIFCLES